MKNCEKILRLQAKIQKLMFDLGRKKNGRYFFSAGAKEKINQQIEMLRNQIR